MKEKLVEFYENLINDVADERKREEFFGILNKIDEDLSSLDYSLGEELENQEDVLNLESDYDLSNEFYYSNCMPM